MSSLKDRRSSPRRDEPPLRSVNMYVACAFWIVFAIMPLLCLIGFAVLLR